MLKNNKGLSSHLIILLIIGIVVSFFLFFILNGIYGVSHVGCSKINFQVKDSCKTSGSVKFKVENLNNESLRLTFNQELIAQNIIPANSMKSISFPTKADSVDLVPYVVDKGQIYFCQGRAQSQNIVIISKKC